MAETRGAKVDVVCACGCLAKFKARVADRKRGWGKFATKSCKAKWQEARTGQHSNYIHRQRRRDYDDEPTFSNAHLFSNEEHDCNKGD